MPREQMNEQQVAAYLDMDVREVHKLASRGRMPCRKVGGKFVFTKVELDHWVFERMRELNPGALRGIEQGVSKHHGYDASELLLTSLIPPEGIVVPLDARTGDAVLRRMVDHADSIGLVWVRDELLEELRKREQLCSTSLFPHVAMPHPRHPVPYDIAESFVTVGLTAGGVPYGAEDGTLTQLFFLICAKDERTHLHVLARLARMLHETPSLADLLAAESPEQLRGMLVDVEAAVVARGG